MLFELLLLLISLGVFVCYYIRHKQLTHWQNLGVKCPPPQFPLGNMADFCTDVTMARRNLHDVAKEQYKQMKGVKFYGTYQIVTPMLVLADPELIKQVLVKDFSHFVDRLGPMGQKVFGGGTRVDGIWRQMLLMSGGETWKNTRMTFTPIFTSGKMKTMFNLMQMVNERLMESFEQEAKTGSEIEIKEKFGKFSMDTIALCAFGMDAQSFTNPKSDFVKHARSVFRKEWMDIAKILLVFVVPGGLKLMQLLQIPVFKTRETTFFDEVLQTTLRERKMANTRRNDLIDMMLDALKEESSGKQDEPEDKDSKFNHKVDRKDLDEITIISTALIMLIAGYDTTSQTMSYATYEMAMNPDIQKRLQDEIDEAMDDGQFPDYNKIQSMEYLDKAFHETLRLHPPVATLSRACVEEGCTINSIKIHKGQEIFINVAGIHSDPEYYPDPDKFNPEHFSKDARANRHPYTFLGFGQGPRNCIGMRFAMLEAKIALVSLFSKYSVVKSENTVEKVTLDPASGFSAPLDGLYVKLIPRN